MNSLDSACHTDMAKLIDEESGRFTSFSSGNPPYMIINLLEGMACDIGLRRSILERFVRLALSSCYLSGRYDYPVLVTSNDGHSPKRLTFQTPWDGTGLSAPSGTSLTSQLRWVFLQPRRDVLRDLSIMTLRKFAFAHGIAATISRSSDTGFSIAATLPWIGPYRSGMRQKPLILIVEDVKPLYLLMNMYLLGEGYDVLWAPQGEIGLRMAHEHHPDMIVLNINMPVMNGYECLKTLKQHEQTRMIPVVMCSVTRDTDTSLELGAVDHIVKPIIKSDFIPRIRRVLMPPSGASPRPVTALDTVCLLSARDPWLSRMKTVFDVERRIAIYTAGDFALDHVLHLQKRPDAFVIDMEEETDELRSMIMMLRLSEHLEQVPIVAVTSPRTRTAAEYWHGGEVDTFVNREALEMNGPEPVCIQSTLVHG